MILALVRCRQDPEDIKNIRGYMRRLEISKVS